VEGTHDSKIREATRRQPQRAAGRGARDPGLVSVAPEGAIMLTYQSTVFSSTCSPDIVSQSPEY